MKNKIDFKNVSKLKWFNEESGKNEKIFGKDIGLMIESELNEWIDGYIEDNYIDDEDGVKLKGLIVEYYNNVK